LWAASELPLSVLVSSVVVCEPDADRVERVPGRPRHAHAREGETGEHERDHRDGDRDPGYQRAS